MNIIEELHAKVRNDLREKRPGEYITDAEVGAAFGSVTVDIVIRFLEWVRDNGYYYHDPEYGPKGWTTSLFKNGVATAELFNSEEFQKTI